MNKLKCRKQKMNGMFECKKTGKIITLKECINCKNKEYKLPIKDNSNNDKLSTVKIKKEIYILEQNSELKIITKEPPHSQIIILNEKGNITISEIPKEKEISN